MRLVRLAVRTLHQRVDLAAVITDERHADEGYAATGGWSRRTAECVYPPPNMRRIPVRLAGVAPCSRFAVASPLRALSER